ncbi:MAG: hypothetical protein M0D57_17775 [Sphingobacteriales bacterium JAD_PAG50586_3]|nr:MAG: hypothetical protein M0D57_17775 [Sphingobacteriales bacterium JAD_PAG50586_3]
MLKPLYIICLFALIGLGLVGCEKEQITTLPDSTPQQYFFTIKDTSEYNSADFYINTDVRVFPSPNSSIEFDIDNDNINDIRLTHEHIGSNGSGNINVVLNDLTPDSSLTFSAKTNNLYSPFPYQLGDTISESQNWSYINHFLLTDLDYTPNSDYVYYWNWGDPDLQYLAFRKKIGSDYKYGWFMIGGYIGLSVIQL